MNFLPEVNYKQYHITPNHKTQTFYTICFHSANWPSEYSYYITTTFSVCMTKNYELNHYDSKKKFRTLQNK